MLILYMIITKEEYPSFSCYLYILIYLYYLYYLYLSNFQECFCERYLFNVVIISLGYQYELLDDINITLHII